MPAVRNILVTVSIALAVCSSVSHAQTVPAGQEPGAPVAGAAPAREGLIDLDAMTFSCPREGLNAAAREAAKVPSQGTYQFSFFRIVNDAHHASYEVHFKSNYEGEKDLKYCVALYCQQGWDPAKAKTTVTLMSNERRPMAGAAHADDCRIRPAPVNRKSKH